MAGVYAMAGEERSPLVKRGVKRLADESSDDQRFTKRFNLLSLDKARNGGTHTSSNYYISIPTSAPNAIPSATPSTTLPVPDDSMSIDETPNRVYVHDLEAELADIQDNEPEERLIFLPDIEKHFSRIPQHVLTGGRSGNENHEGQELVLYDLPKSLTEDEGHVSVRRAILEARQRARQKAAEEARYNDMLRQYGQSQEGQDAETAHGYGNGYEGDMGDSDPDAMDIE